MKIHIERRTVNELFCPAGYGFHDSVSFEEYARRQLNDPVAVDREFCALCVKNADFDLTHYQKRKLR